MAINLYNLRKWYKMLTGNSILHVNQDLGHFFTPGEIRGYFNDMTEKVIKEPELIDSEKLPTVVDENNNVIEFPVSIFQYGLGAFDLFINTGDEKYKKKFFQCVEWAINKQEKSGAWNNFFFYYPDKPYGAMCQGEGASLLIRAYVITNNDDYLNRAIDAINFMLVPIENGGTTDYSNGHPRFLEYTHRPAVLNGWIFALFGLYDLCLVCDDKRYHCALNEAMYELKNSIKLFRGRYWSIYDLDGRIASPFYHNLHIGQMEALYIVTNDMCYKNMADVWIRQHNSVICRTLAFIKKAVQKILEK